jgi:hypothetical protein
MVFRTYFTGIVAFTKIGISGSSFYFPAGDT